MKYVLRGRVSGSYKEVTDSGQLIFNHTHPEGADLFDTASDAAQAMARGAFHSRADGPPEWEIVRVETSINVQVGEVV